MSELSNLRIWWALGGVWIALIVYLSVASLDIPQLDTWGDKINHALAYGFLMGWFGQLISRGKSWLVMAGVLIALGAMMEVWQGWLSHRQFDYYDMAANATGVAIGWLALHAGGDRVLVLFERMLKIGQR